MEKVRIQDDLFNHVNAEWLEQAVIPDDKPSTGGFAVIAEEVENTLIKEFNELCASKNYPNDHLKYACMLYEKLKDVAKRNHDKMKPINKVLNKINKLKDVSALNRNLKEFILNRYPLPFEIDVETDMKDTLHHCLMLGGPQTILPDSSYYKEGMEQQREMMLGLWRQMVSMILAETKLTPEEQALYIDDALKFDAIIGSLVKSNEELSDYIAMYNPMKLRTVSGLMKPLKFRKLLESLCGTAPETIIVIDPRFLKGFNTLFNEANFELYKHWAYISMILGSTSILSEHLRELGSMYRNALFGIAAIPSVEKNAYQLTSQVFSEPIGLYYGKKYFGEAAKQDARDMVKDIIDTYKVRIKNSDILSDATKDKAILKLSTMECKIGYPDNVDPMYDKIVFNDEDSIADMFIKFYQVIRANSFAKLYKDVDRARWIMPGHLVNACYNPTVNDITFPAAILQSPFYDVKRSRSANLGGIGAVIGHEISHAFDNNGAKCDENGNINNWWTKEDFKKFEQRTKDMIKEFEGIELPWGKVNASFIVSENIADNGGMAVTLNIMKNMKDANYEDYFTTWAKIWCMKAKPEFLQLLLQVDVHAPAILRCNMQPRNFDEWYETFDVKESDKMYLAKKDRVVIW